jgi:hypothetical protein
MQSLRRPFEHVGRRYELAFAPRPTTESLRFDRHTARRLLRVAMGDRAAMRRLRSLLAARVPFERVSRLTDAEVIEELAARVGMHDLHVYAEPIPRPQVVLEHVAEVDDALAPLSLRETEEPVDDRIDAEAQAAVMRDAAKDGVPFCEECEKARPAQARPPEVEPFASTDVATQADAMRAAAAAGVPFCEECERARKAGAAASPAGG